MDFEDSHTTRFEVNGVGAWEIRICPLAPQYMHVLKIPGKYQGNANDVVFFVGEGAVPDTAKIAGNKSKGLFQVMPLKLTDGEWHEDSALVNELFTPYEEERVLEKDTRGFVVDAEGPWTIEVTTR